MVLSSSPIPGNEKAVYDVINDLFRKGANVIYDSMNDIHVSGHAYEEELKLMLTLVQPQFFMPVHGEYRHQFKHAEIAKSLGVLTKNIVIANIGESYGFNQKGVRQHSNVTAGNTYVDGVVLEDGKSVINDRRSLAEYGMLLVLCAVDLETGKIVGDVDIIARGFNLTEDVQASIRNATQETIDAADFDKVNVNDVARLVKKAVRKLFYKDRQFPIIIPIIVED
ncbi:MAG: ribonuclease J [Christensenella sp.]|nr:MAG: ribonuclease J [Christensenella sp.]